MPYIDVDPNLPGIRQLMAFSPETAEPMGKLANLMLKTDEGLTMAEREAIATFVSHLNDCFYCRHSHGAIVGCYLNDNNRLIDQITTDYHRADISDKLKTLLTIAGAVQRSGKAVTQQAVDDAKRAGATDKDIHDTVLIAALFCMFNRYVDGLASTAPADLSTYPLRAQQIAAHGYGNYIFSTPQPI